MPGIAGHGDAGAQDSDASNAPDDPSAPDDAGHGLAVVQDSEAPNVADASEAVTTDADSPCTRPKV